MFSHLKRENVITKETGVIQRVERNELATELRKPVRGPTVNRSS
jgi:hypothetical protein